MSDKGDTRGDVQVKLSITDWQKVPSRTYSRDVTIDGEDWRWATPSDRQEMIQEEMNAFFHETFEVDWNVTSEHDIFDPQEES